MREKNSTNFITNNKNFPKKKPQQPNTIKPKIQKQKPSRDKHQKFQNKGWICVWKKLHLFLLLKPLNVAIWKHRNLHTLIHTVRERKRVGFYLNGERSNIHFDEEKLWEEGAYLLFFYSAHFLTLENSRISL